MLAAVESFKGEEESPCVREAAFPKLLAYRMHITEFVPRITLSTLQLIGVDLWSPVDIHSHSLGFTLEL